MHNLPFHILDVFAEKKFAGNQLAVFHNASILTSDEMLQIAREMNFSETTFILSDTPRDGGFDVRIFTPKEEVPFAGHPTLGTAYVIRSLFHGDQVQTVTLNLQAGKIPVTFGQDGYAWMQQLSPQFGEKHPPERMASILGLEPADLDERFPVQEVSTGLPFFIVPLKSLRVLVKARVDQAKCFDLIEHTVAKGILVFSAETREPHNNVAVRVFVDYYGVPEDAATGSANGCLAGYLVQYRVFGGSRINLRSEQGHEMGRPSLLLLSAEQGAGGIQISVGGRCIIVARGELT